VLLGPCACRERVSFCSSAAGYRKKWDEDHGVWEDRPWYDHASHTSDSLPIVER